MRDDTETAALKRLSRIEGQVRGVAGMIKDGRYCIDTIRQIKAVRSALASLEQVILDDHLSTCVDAAMKSDDIQERQAKLTEVVNVMRAK